MIARTTPASRPSPSRGGLRPAWTPTPHTRTSTHARKTRKTAPAHPNQDLTGPAPFMDDQHRQDENCPMWHWVYLTHRMPHWVHVTHPMWHWGVCPGPSSAEGGSQGGLSAGHRQGHRSSGQVERHARTRLRPQGVVMDAGREQDLQP